MACAPFARLVEVHVVEVDQHMAYVGFDQSTRRIVLVLRGALSIADWVKSFEYKKIAAYAELGCAGCMVHKGFLVAFQALQPGIEAAVHELALAHPAARVAITGHSMGAALAVHAAIALGPLGRNVSLDTGALYTYGQPRVGDSAFAAFFMWHFPTWLRIVHWNDPVPHLPPFSTGFHHVGREIWFDEPSDTRMICNDTGEDSDCSASVEVAVVLTDHYIYLSKKVVQCAPFAAPSASV